MTVLGAFVAIVGAFVTLFLWHVTVAVVAHLRVKQFSWRAAVAEWLIVSAMRVGMRIVGRSVLPDDINLLQNVIVFCRDRADFVRHSSVSGAKAS